jgi:cyclopropane fatty-acyl-phospholipid synthase-like methyltransferase
MAVVRDPYQRTRLMLRRNTPLRSRRDIAAHYDLGNDLFELMLDPTMTYSCALFERPGMSLEEASTAKLEGVCAKLDIGPGDHIVEIGSGGAASRCTPRARAAAASRRQRSRASSTPSPRRACAPRGSPTASRSSLTTTASCTAATTSSSRSR